MLKDIEAMLRNGKPENLPLIFDNFQRLDFVKTLEECLGEPLPRAQEALIDLFERKDLSLPPVLTVSELLDKLASIYLEPRCQQPTFLINHPAELSPLAKSTDGISHRFELIVNGVELVNAYEEENDPELQRAKFEAQANAHGRSGLTADEDDYCRVLEWGLPPTAGWGLGVDRLCMMLTGQTRINEVLLGGGILFQPFEKEEPPQK
jgi:lysyl-tRNA synthetase class 2